MAKTFLVTDAATLKRVLWLQRQSRVAIWPPRLGRVDGDQVQERINRLLGVSGYGLGLSAIVATLVLGILWVGGHWEFFVAHWLPALGLGATACLFVGALGRLAGFLYARWRLARLISLTVAAMDGSGSKVHGISSQRAALLARKTIAQ